MKCEIHLSGRPEDFRPKFDKLSAEDQAWLFEKKRLGEGDRFLSMDLEEVIRFLTIFNEIEKIYFEVR
jgi:hypothetical protein